MRRVQSELWMHLDWGGYRRSTVAAAQKRQRRSGQRGMRQLRLWRMTHQSLSKKTTDFLLDA